MIVLASLVVLFLMVWALVLARFGGVASGWLWAVAGGLLASTGLAWLAVFLGVSGSLWALFNQEGEARKQVMMAGLGVASLSGLGVLLLCVPALIFLIVQTVAAVRHIDASRPPMRP